MIARHTTRRRDAAVPALAVLKTWSSARRADADWMRFGFIMRHEHGQHAISGETSDYGPCAFMDEYLPHGIQLVDRGGAMRTEPARDCAVDLARLAETLLPRSLRMPTKPYGSRGGRRPFIAQFEVQFLDRMRRKVGLASALDGDPTRQSAAATVQEANGFSR